MATEFLLIFDLKNYLKAIYRIIANSTRCDSFLASSFTVELHCIANIRQSIKTEFSRAFHAQTTLISTAVTERKQHLIFIFHAIVVGAFFDYSFVCKFIIISIIPRFFCGFCLSILIFQILKPYYN